MVKSHDLRDVAVSHYKNGEKLRKLLKYWQIRSIEVRLIVGLLDINNLVRLK